jgi:hypothetical protein
VVPETDTKNGEMDVVKSGENLPEGQKGIYGARHGEETVKDEPVEGGTQEFQLMFRCIRCKQGAHYEHRESPICSRCDRMLRRRNSPKTPFG